MSAPKSRARVAGCRGRRGPVWHVGWTSQHAGCWKGCPLPPPSCGLERARLATRATCWLAPK
eukprot:12401468-Heterocapsa_arctica.AAC.1